MKKLLYTLLILFVITGCGSQKINSGSKLIEAKNEMLKNLDSFNFNATMVTKTGIANITTTMNCTENRTKKLIYCKTSTIGTTTEQYMDYGNHVVYTKVDTLVSKDSKWSKEKYESKNTNEWLNISDYVFNLEETEKNNGTLFKGTVDSNILAKAASKSDSSIDLSKVISKDIEIEIFVNSQKYIETMSYTMNVLGLDQTVEIEFTDFNSAKNIELPSELK